MKKAFTFLLTIFSISTLHAQSSAPERVVAEVQYLPGSPGNYVLLDSFRFSYSNGRHSTFDYNDFRYLKYNGYGAIADVCPDFLLADPSIMSNIPPVAFDTLRIYARDPHPGNAPVFSSLEACSYNTDTTINTIVNVEQILSGTRSPVLRQIILYNAGRVAKVYQDEYNAGIWDTTNVRAIFYNSSGNVVLDSFAKKSGGILLPNLRNYYTYNAAGHCLTRLRLLRGVSNNWDTSDRITNTYYPNGQLLTSAVEYIKGIYRKEIDSFIYTFNVPGFTKHYHELYDLGGYVGGYQEIARHITAQNRVDSFTLSNFDPNTGGGYLSASTKLVYNASGNPTLFESFSLDTNGTQIGTRISIRWYYEHYNVGIPSHHAPDNSITISPNPTTGIITLRYPEAKPGTPISVRITNAAGQPVHSETFILQGTSQQILLGAEAVPGIYYVSVYDNNGGIICSRPVLKQ